MALTRSEVDDIDRLLGRMESQDKNWRIVRWVMVGGAVFFAFSAAWLYTTLSPLWDVPIAGGANHSVTQGSLVHERVMTMGHIARYVAMYILMLLSGCLATMSAFAIFAQRTRVKRNALLVKLARSFLDTQRLGTETVHKSFDAHSIP